MHLSDILRLSSTGDFVIDSPLVEHLRGHYDGPQYIYHPEIVHRKISLIRRAFPNWKLLYSVKANPVGGLMRHIVNFVDGFEAASLGELHRIQGLKAPNNVITLLTHPGKTEETIGSALNLGVTAINIESPTEAKRASHVGALRGTPVPVFVRINCLSASGPYGDPPRTR